jgi:broad specificity phosphatase PhoE
MQILLVRHGKVEFDFNARVSRLAATDQLARFNAAGIALDSKPSADVCTFANDCALLVSSDLARAVASARILAPRRKLVVDALFREAEVPVRLPLPFSMQFRRWVVWARLLWLLGFHRGCESLLDVRRRARAAAGRLQELATQHGSVTLVGHGYFNSMLALQLRRLGWRGARLNAPRHWSAAVFVKA